MKKVFLYMAAVALFLICLMPVASAETLEDCINNLILPKQRYNIDMNQSYENNNFTDGSINPQSGEFVLRQTDYTLPGINGLDVDITRIYRSGQVSNYQMYTKLESGTLVGCEDANWFAPQAMAFYDSRYFLGAGWRFSFPTIEFMQSSDGTAYRYLHTDSGAVYRLLDPVTVDGVETFELEGYKLDDMVVQGYDGSFPEAEEVPRYMLIEKDGTRTYFSGDSNNNYEGVILGIKDRYGNYMKFYHDEISYFVEHDASQEAYYEINYAPITKIVDSAGREILFDYHADDDDFWTDGTDLQHNFDVTITLPDGQMILYTKSNMRFTGEMGRSTRQRLEGVYTLTDATQYGVNGYYGEAKYLYGYEYAKNAFSARDEEMENVRGNYWENLNFIAWGDTNRGKAIEYENVTEKFGTSGRQLNRRGKAIKDLLLDDYTIITPPINGLGSLQDYWSGSSYTGTTIDENYYYYDDEHPSLANPLEEGFESESSEDFLIQSSQNESEWKRSKAAARDGQYGLYNTLSGYEAKATLDLGVTGDFTIGIDAKIGTGSEGEGSFQIGMVKEDGTTTYEEIPLVAGEDWKTFTVRGYDIRKIVLLYEPSGYTIYLDNLFVGKGYETEVAKTENGLGESYSYTYENLLYQHNFIETNESSTETYEYDEHDLPSKITTSVNQYGYDSDGTALSSQKQTVQTYTYDDYGNLLSYSGPEYNGAHVEYTYASPEKYHTVTSKTEKDADGTVLSCTNYTVDDLGNITQEQQQYAGAGTTAQYQYTLYTYDTHGNLLSKQRNNPADSNATTEYYEYGAIDDTHTDGGLYVTKKYSGANISPTWYTYDFDTGLLLSEKRNNGVADIVTSYEYDSKYRVTKMSENKGDTEYTYNDKGRYIYGDYVSNQVVEVETPQDHVMYELNIYGDIVQEVDYDTNLYRNYYEYDVRYNGNRVIVRQIDANEKSTYYTYDILDRLTQKKYSDNSTVNISYLGQPSRIEQYGAEYSVTITDENGNDTTYYLDKADRILATETSPDGTTYYAVKNEYDALGRKVKTIDARGNATTYEYDMRSRLVKTTDALGNNTLYTYNGNDKVVDKTEPQQGNAYTAYDYDSAGRLIHEGQGFDDAVHYDRQYRTITYNNCDAIASQELTRVEQNEYYTDSDIVYVYDSDNRIARKIETDGTLQRITDYDYDFNGNITLEKTYANEEQTEYIQTYYNYDKLNRKTWQISSAYYNGQTVGTQRIAYFYDNMDHLTEVREYKGADDDAGYLSTLYEYDQRYNLTKKTEPSGVVTQYTYDAKGNPIAQTLTAGGQSYSTTNQYDKLGRLVSTTNALGQMTQYAYDENGNKTITMDARFADAPINVSASYILMEYDALNRPVKKILHDGSWDETISEVREYDSRGNVTKLMNGEGYADGQKGTVMTYDFANNMITSATPEAAAAGKVSKQYHYDAAKRLLGETIYQNAADTGATTSYAYDFDQLSSTVDPQGNEEEHTYDLTGKLFEQITDKNGNVTKIFKSLYGTPYKTEYPDGTTETIDFDWYLGLAIAVTDRKNRKRKYQYNNAKQITEESYIYDTDESGTEYERMIAYTYDAFGNLTKQELKKRIGTSSEDLGQTTEYTYDALFRVTAVEKSDGSEVLYQYDAAGNTTQKKYRTAQDVYEVWGYSYDWFNRLSSESVMVDNSFMDGQGTGQEAKKTTYTYNAAGKVQSKTDPNNHTTTYAYDASGNLIQETSPSGAVTQYSYDYAGNLTQKTNAIGGYEKYGYDSLLRLVSKKTNPANDTDGELTWTYGYDAKGNLISEQTPAMVRAGADKKLTYTYDNMNQLTASYNAEGQLLKAYKYDNAGNLIKEVDGLHATSASEIDTASGTSYVYDAFDNVTSQTDAAGNTTGYAYNLRGDLTSQTDARGNTTSYTYNDEGRLASVQYPDGGQISYTYDDKGRVLTQTTKQSSSVSATETYTYTPFDTVYTMTDAAGNVTTTLCDGLGNPVSVTDARGNTTQYSYNADGRLSQVTTPLTDTVNMVESYTYDGAGNVLTVTQAGDEAAPSRVTTYTYLAGGLVASVSNNAGQSTLYEYDGAGNLSQQKVLRDSGVGTYDTTSWTYDLYDRPVTASQQLTLNDSGQTATATTSYTYNILGMKTSESTPLSTNAEYTGQYTTSYAYDTLGRLSSVSRFHDNNGAPQAVTTQYTYDAVGNQTSVTDEAGYTTAYAYDSMNRVTSVTNALNETTSYEYDLAGNCVKEARPNGTWTYEYDAMNRLSVTKNPNGTVVQKLLYDENGNVVKTIDAKGYASASTDSARYGTVYTYNQANMVAQITTAEGNTTMYAYTAQGDVKSVTDGENNTTSYTYDSAGRVVSATNAEGETTSYTYDLAGNQTKMTDGLGHETHYGYGAFGMLLSVTDALDREIQYGYDVEGNLTQMTDRGGSVTTYGYDNRGNLTSKSADGQSITYSYDTMGNRLSMTDSTGSYTYTYDALGRMTAQAKDGSTQVSYGYDAAGNMTSMSYNGITVAYTYDNQNRMTAASGGGASASYSYDDNGNITSASYGSGAVHETRQYNKDNAVTKIENSTSDGTAVYQYTYDGAGRVATKTDPYGTTSYVYDAAGRLLKVTMPGAETEYTYDAAGNRSSMTQTSTSAKTYHDVQANEDLAYNKAVTTYTYTETNELAKTDRVLYNESTARITENTTYSYDPSGNLYSSVVAVMRAAAGDAELALGTEDNSLVTMTVNTYDVWNQLVKTSVTKQGQTSEVSYTYNGDGIRTSRTVAEEDSTKTVQYLTSGGTVLAQTGDDTATYVRGMGYIAKIGVSNDVHYYQYNAHGDVVQVASGASGEVENRYDYDAFGEEILAVEETPNDIRYSGEFYDAEAGLYYLRARYYDPATGRFTQEDTYRGDVMEPASLNLYAYCVNDPVNYVDPSGHGKVWNNFGEVIGTTDGPDYVDRSDAANSIHGGGEQAQQPIYATDPSRDKTAIYSPSTGYATLVYTDELESYQSVGWHIGSDRIAVFDPVTGAQSEAYADEILRKRKGDHTGTWVTANETITVYNEATGESRECEAWELWGLRIGDDSGVWRTAEESVTVYNEATGESRTCEAWEVAGLRAGDESGYWRTANEKVVVFDAVTGKQSECEAWELWGKRIGDDTGTWRTANEKITVYDANTGKQSECEAWELWGKRIGDDTGVWRTGSEQVAVYEYGSGHKSYCRYDELESKRAGDSTGQWGMAGDYIPVYSRMQGKTVYVRGDQAQSYVRNDAAQYAKKKEADEENKFRSRKDKRHGSENRQPSGARERNVGHPNGEEHSRKAKGNRGIRHSEVEAQGSDNYNWGDKLAGVGMALAGVAVVVALVADDASGFGVADNAAIPAAIGLITKGAAMVF